MTELVVKIDASEVARELALIEQRLLAMNGAAATGARVALPALAAAAAAGTGNLRLTRRGFLFPFRGGK